MGKLKPENPDDDVLYLPSIDDIKVTDHLEERYGSDKIYTRIGHRIMVMVNPYKPLDASDETIKSYTAKIKEGQERESHVFELAACAYNEMCDSKLDQSILFLGETGSGKSEAFKMALRQIVSMSKSRKRDNKVAERIMHAVNIMEAFGHARTTQNANASRHGKLFELQFNGRQKLSGAKISDYLLDKTRTTSVPAQERNFHVFYYMLAGAAGSVRSEMQLQDVTKYTCLQTPKAIRSEQLEDASRFSELKISLKSLGLKDKYQTNIFQLLASLLHLEALVFEDPEAKDDAAMVKNIEILNIAAELLGVKTANLENTLVYKTKLIKKEICTMYLDKEEAAEQCDALVRTLYSLLWTWLMECLNRRLCDENPLSVLSLVDMFGVENLKENRLHQLMYNYTAEKMLMFANGIIFDKLIQECEMQSISFPRVAYGDNAKVVDLFVSSVNGIFTILDEESSKSRRKTKTAVMLDRINAAHEDNSFFVKFPKKSKFNLFGIRHHSQDVHYDASDFMELNNDNQICADFITLFRGGPETKPSKNSFIVNLFSDEAVDVERATDRQETVIVASTENGPRRKPSVRSKGRSYEDKDRSKSNSTFSSQYGKALDELLESLGESDLHFVFCLKPNNKQEPNDFEVRKMQQQVSDFGLADMALLRAKGFGRPMLLDHFINRYRILAPEDVDRARSMLDKVDAVGRALDFTERDMAFGKSKVFLSDAALRLMDLKFRQAQRAEKNRLKLLAAERSAATRDDEASDMGSEFGDGETQADPAEYHDDETASNADMDFQYDSQDTSLGKSALGMEELQPEEEEVEISRVRRIWLFVTTMLTWWIPTKLMEYSGMRRSDIQLAWREKVALCILIVILSGMMIFFIVGFSNVMCPRKDMIDFGELSEHSIRGDMWVAVRGVVYDVSAFRDEHPNGGQLVDDFAGRDASVVFLLDASMCGLEEEQGLPLKEESTEIRWKHDLEVYPRLVSRLKKQIKGRLAWTRREIALNHAEQDSYFIIVDGVVYDMTYYRANNQKYYGDAVSAAILQSGGRDATSLFMAAGNQGKAAVKCMNQIQRIGVIDSRDSPQCFAANIMLLTSTGVLVAIMVIKFLCALRFGNRGAPEDYDRFVICQVPCYTESEESLRRTIDSLATLRYDDKRKLLFIIVDGNIIGSGNDRATWRIVLDILGVDPSIDPPKLSFQSLGEGNRQHNMGKVYTGLYDCSGHLVPYIVVVKMGKDNEIRRPGNRGKRDSQLLLMRFLQKVHYEEPMSPLELEIYHQMKNVIGIEPSFYEFVLMVDADTEVYPDALNRLVSSMAHDAQVVGICGETTLANEWGSWITTVQVYEYYISHHLAKAFESLFGSVTCLPYVLEYSISLYCFYDSGCFCMYRIRTPNKSIPLLTSKSVVMDYSENNVDTLHKKNLLSLGEDRYLTTLMLKHFPNMKLKFVPDAQCKTYAPDRASILLSQRRRWINSTVHNLLELLMLPQLCGFCCFSMRFIIFFDLFATLVMPATMAYLAYLIYGAVKNNFYPMISLILLAAGYGLQVLVFLLKGQWQHIGWLIIYLLALPIFTFFIPLYSFWHFDDFSWGNTRIVIGEKGGKKQIIDEEPFDPNSIPMTTWTDYEQKMLETESMVSGTSRMTRASYVAHSPIPQSVMSASVVYPPSYVAPQPVMGMSMMPPAMAAPQPVYTAPTYTPSVVSLPRARASSIPSTQLPTMTSTFSPPVAPPNDEPTEDQIVSQIKTILATADLMTVTKKLVREELSAFFGVDMTPKKEFINRVIEKVLQGET